jgi:hypothetical protein
LIEVTGKEMGAKVKHGMALADISIQIIISVVLPKIRESEHRTFAFTAIGWEVKSSCGDAVHRAFPPKL